MQPVKKDIHVVSCENDKEDQHPDKILIFIMLVISRFCV